MARFDRCFNIGALIPWLQGKSTSTMDYVPSPESFYAPDIVKSTFAASPNSLYMYDQERHDMQNTLSNGMFGQTCPGTGMVPLTAEPEFDLNPQFENSNSLEGFFGGALTRSLMPSPCEGSIGGSASGRSEKPDSTGLLGLLEVSQQELKLGGPTLAELNMDPFLMEDIDNLIENEEEEKKPVVGAVKQMGCSDVMKQLTAGQSGQMEAAPKTLTTLNTFNPTTTTTSLSSQPRAELTQLHTQPLSRPAAPLSSPYGGNRTLNVAVVPPISVSAITTIKTEPMDTYESGDKPCLHKMLSSSPPVATQRAASVSPPQCGSASPGRRVMPVVGQTRAPPLGQQVKAESVEEKWKEIEKFIHDPETSSSSSSRKRKRHGESVHVCLQCVCLLCVCVSSVYVSPLCGPQCVCLSPLCMCVCLFNASVYLLCVVPYVCVCVSSVCLFGVSPLCGPLCVYVSPMCVSSVYLLCVAPSVCASLLCVCVCVAPCMCHHLSCLSNSLFLLPPLPPFPPYLPVPISP